MHYQFHNLTGRLTGTNNPHALFPITPVPLDKNDPPKVVYANAQISKIAEPRKMSGSAQLQGSPVPEKIRRKMERMQIKDGLPVFLKGGPMDKVLFGITVGLCVVGVGLSFKLIYDLSYPKKH